MKIQLYIDILAFACLASCDLMSDVKPKNEVGQQFQKLLNSIAANDSTKTDDYQKFVRDYIVKEELAFDQMKEEIRNARRRNVHKSSDISIAAIKRQTNQKHTGRAGATTTDSSTTDKEQWQIRHARLAIELANAFSDGDPAKFDNVTAKYTSPAIISPCFFVVFRVFLSYCCTTFKLRRPGGVKHPVPIPRNITEEETIKVVFWASKHRQFVEFRALYYRACEAPWLTDEDICERTRNTCMKYPSLRA